MPQELFQLSWRRYVETSIALLAGVFTFYIGAVSTLFVKYAEFVLFLVGDDTPYDKIYPASKAMIFLTGIGCIVAIYYGVKDILHRSRDTKEKLPLWKRLAMFLLALFTIVACLVILTYFAAYITLFVEYGRYASVVATSNTLCKAMEDLDDTKRVIFKAFYTESPKSRILVKEFIRLPSGHCFLPVVNVGAVHPVHAHTCMFECHSNHGYGDLQGHTITIIKNAVNSSRGETFGISVAPSLIGV